MENQEMTNFEVMEVAEEITTSSSNNVLKSVGVAALIAGVVYGGYKLIKKIRAKKNEVVVEGEIDCEDCTEIID